MAQEYHTIQVIDSETKRGVPMVQLKTVNKMEYWSDSNGIIAFFEPGLMNKKIFFFVSSHGYEFPKDGFGFEGTSLITKPKGKTILEIKRINKAERLYRSSGYGIYRDSLLVSEKIPIKEPLLNSQVTGLDSVLSSIYKGKIYFFWGDTLNPSYPLGNFHVSGGVSNLPNDNNLDIELGINYKYFQNVDGFVKSVAPIEPKAQPTWIHATVVLKENEKEIMVAGFHKPASNNLKEKNGFIKWNDEKNEFELLKFIDDSNVSPPIGSHVLKIKEGEKEVLYFTDPYAMVKVEATVEKFTNPKEYFAFTCLKEGTNLKDWSNVQLDRDVNGVLKYGWKKNTAPVQTLQYLEMINRNLIKKSEAYFLQMKDFEQNEIVMHRGTIKYNPYKKKYILIGTQFGGDSSKIGEIFYSESSSIVGPWRWAVKIITHKNIDFYNPAQHDFFDKQNGKIIFIEGTYTRTFDKLGIPTPMYEYNQQFYKLNLDYVTLPQPIYLDENQKFTSKLQKNGKIQFYAFLKNYREFEMVPVVFENEMYFERKFPSENDEIVFYSMKTKLKNTIDYYVHPIKNKKKYSLQKSEKFAFRVITHQ
eukprot:gene7627-11949_t